MGINGERPEQLMEDFRRIMSKAGVEREGHWSRIAGGERRGTLSAFSKQQALWVKVRRLIETQIQRDRQEVQDLLDKCNRIRYGGSI